MAQQKLDRVLGLRDTTMLVVGSVIGSGIFLVPSNVAAPVGSPVLILAVWLVGGALSLIGALSIAELGAAIPEAGGLYVYLRRAYGELCAFLFGWALLLVIGTGGLTTLAVGFVNVLAYLVPLTQLQMVLISMAAILLLMVVNIIGVRPGAMVQNFFGYAKVAALVMVVGLAFIFGRGQVANFTTPPATFTPGTLAAFGTALIAALWAYEGWHYVTCAAGEVVRPERNLPRGLIYGTLIVVVIYLSANLAYLYILPAPELAQSQSAAATTLERVFANPVAGQLISVAVMMSIFGALNGQTLTCPRVYYAMARDQLFPASLARVSPRFHTPAVALVLQGVWGCGLVLLFGSFSSLFNFVVFAGWIFYGLAAAAVIVMRWREPQLLRPYRVPGYPVLPLIFSAGALLIVANTLVQQPREALYGLGFIALGIPVFFLWRRLRPARAVAAAEVVEPARQL